VVIVGAGAAGLATAIFTRRTSRARSVVLLDGARAPGAKILVSGGSRCNVTNRIVSEMDFWGGRRTLVRSILRAFTAADTVRFFQEIGVPLHEEAGGKLFPDSNRSRDVLQALLREVDRTGGRLLASHRVLGVETSGGGFLVTTTQGLVMCRSVVLATGGQSLPKSGSDGAGFQFAQKLGHTIVPATPALVPLLLDAADAAPMHRRLSGVAHDAELHVWAASRLAVRLRGPMLWTHFGISGPVALDASRHWLRAELEGLPVRLSANLCPGETFESLDRAFTRTAAERPQISIATLIGRWMPPSVASALLDRLAVDSSRTLGNLTRAERRRLVHALTDWPLAVRGSRGYTYAEATAGGVALDEVRTATMESRVCRGLYLVGEILDVDGRLGGFNFQWAWSTAYVAGRALGR
jgi:predicted Rossmann fold flavoprotein